MTALLTAILMLVPVAEGPQPATFVHTVGRTDMIETYLEKTYAAEIIEIVQIDWHGNPAYRARFRALDPEAGRQREHILVFDAGSVQPIAELEPERNR